MFFTEPIDFEDALKEALARDLVPTDLGSAQISRWDVELKRRSVFTARGTNADFLQTISDITEKLAAGKINQAKARELLKESADLLDYSAEHGFPGDAAVGVPPAERGSLQDLAGEDRMNLILDTQARQIANYGYFAQGQTPFALHAWPCWELIRIAPRRVPRGLRNRKGVLVPDPANAWPARWVKAGGKIYAGRMIARKDDPVWDALGDPQIFRDGLGQPYPPFAFNSGYGLREISREEAVRLGVIEAKDKLLGSARPMNEGALMSVKGLDTDFLKALRADLDVEVKAGELRLRDEMAERKRAYLAAANEEVALFMLELMIDAANTFNPEQLRDAHGRWEEVDGAATQPLTAWEKASLDGAIKRVERNKTLAEDLYQRHGMKVPQTLKEHTSVPAHVTAEWQRMTGERIAPLPQLAPLQLRDLKEIRDSNDAVRHLQFAEDRYLLSEADYLPLTDHERETFRLGNEAASKRLRGIAWKRLAQRRVDLAKAGAIRPAGAANDSLESIDQMIDAANAGTSSGAIKGWITRREGGKLAGKIFDKATAHGGHAMPGTPFYRVDSGQAARLRAATGLDLEGYQHALDGSAVTHILKQHGDPIKEAKRGQKAITRADFEKIPTIVSKGNITLGKPQPSGLQTIAYQRKTGSDTYYYEEVRTGTKQLAGKTLYKK